MDKEPTITIRGHKFDAYQVDAYWLGMEDERERISKLLKQIRSNCDKYYEEDYLAGLDYAIDVLNDIDGWELELFNEGEK